MEILDRLKAWGYGNAEDAIKAAMARSRDMTNSGDPVFHAMIPMPMPPITDMAAPVSEAWDSMVCATFRYEGGRWRGKIHGVDGEVIF